MDVNPDTLSFTLRGQMPSGKNQIRMAIVRRRIMKFPDERFKLWRAESWQQLSEQRNGRPTITTPCAVAVRYVPGDFIRRDVPGIMDALCHLLEWCPIHGKKKTINCNQRAIADDSLLQDWHWWRGEVDRENPRIEVAITSLSSFKLIN